jgi:hypothetical protein
MTGKTGLGWMTFIIVLSAFTSCQKTFSGDGVVMDKDSGLPLRGVSVDAYLDHPSPDTYQMHTETDVHGRYFVTSDPQVCTGSCPDLVVKIILSGYTSEYVKNPHGDTTFLSRENPSQSAKH